MSEKVNLILPDGSVKSFPGGITGREVALSIGPGLARAAVACQLDGRIIEMNRPLEHGGHFRILTCDDEEGLEVYRHSVAHVMAQAVKRLYSDVKLGIGPAIEDGFYYDFDLPEPLTSEDLEQVEEIMKEIISEDQAFERIEVEEDKAREVFERLDEPYKLELLEEIEEEEVISCYQNGDFIDLCRGPHLPSTGRIEPRGFSLLQVAGAYWRGDEDRAPMQRIYGTAFADRSDLQEHLEKLEEAKRRDHRRLGRELDLFSTHPEEGGPGLIYWHPRGFVIRQEIEGFWRATHRDRGYDLVSTPHIAKKDLWSTSGHLQTFKENMFNPMEVEGQEYLLKPMNCPFHIMMYKTQTRSYRDLPLRWAELGTVYRYERSGVLHGLLRVRGFTQDDAHIFCRPDQVEDEIVGVVRLAQYMLTAFGYDEYEIALSIRGADDPEKYIGDADTWEQAEEALREALRRIGIDYKEDPGEAKFYGPAIDIKMMDALGRGWQGPTIQLDFNLPRRFEMAYIGADGQEHRPVMIHRTVLGSMERFVGGLIEHYAGAFPPWLAPVQVVIIPVTSDHVDYAREVKRDLSTREVRVNVDDRNEKVGYKIRSAEVEKVPYMLVVGDREVDDGTVSVRTRSQGDLGPRRLDDFRKYLFADIGEMKLEPSLDVE